MSEQQLKKDNIEVNDEDIEDSVMAQYLDVLIQRRKAKENISTYYNNIILFETKKPEKLKNTVLSFNPQSIKPIFDLSTLQLSNLVPVIELYKIYKKKDGDEELEVRLPFPEYTYRDDLEQIFESRTGRGAGIGIKNFKWNSLAKNQSNLAQFSADIELFLQDASELTKIRNQVTEGNKTYTASVLDLLYPTNKDGKMDSFEYDPTKFFIKARVGWQTRNDRQDKKTIIDNSLLKDLVTEFHLTLYKHDISFEQDGSIRLNISFIAMAEALLDDFANHDILFEDYIDQKDTKIIKEARDTIREKQKQLLQENVSDEDKERIQKDIKESEQEIEKAKIFQKKEKRYIYRNFLSWLIKNERLTFFRLPKEEKNELKIISTFGTSVMSPDVAITLSDSIKKRNEKVSSLEQLTLEEISKLNIDITKQEIAQEDDKYKIDEQKVTEILSKSIQDKYQNKDGGDLIIPYFHLGDILEYFIGRFSSKRPQLAGNEIPSKNIKNKKLRIVLGTFSYSDYGNPQAAFQNGGVIYKTKSVRKGTEQNIVTLTGEKKVANIAHVPINFKSFLRWFNKHIIDSNLEKYSINRFIRDIMYDLVPANLSNRILRSVPATRLSVTMNSETIDDNLEYANGQNIISFLENSYQSRNNYIVDFDNYVLQHNPFQYIKSTKSQNEKYRSVKQTTKNLSNYVFLFSNNEYDNNLSRNYDDDFKKGIPHFYVGEEKGMIKEISFEREDNPKLDAHHIQVANKENQGSIIRNVYNATIEMFGNNLFVPGNMIFINPTFPGMKIGDPTLLQLGLGGYFVILQTNNKISGGKYLTTLNAKWQAFGIDGNDIVSKSLSKQDLEDIQRKGYSIQFIGAR